MVKNVYTAKELMEVALMCIANASEDPVPAELYCHVCKRVVPADEAAVSCFILGHDVETGAK